MEEKSLNLVKRLVILLKVLLIFSFIVGFLMTFNDFKSGFIDGFSGREPTSKEVINVQPAKDSIFFQNEKIQVVGIHSFAIQPKKSLYDGDIWLSFFIPIIAIIALIYFIRYIIAFFQLLNRLQSLKIFDKSNISILRKLIWAFAFYNVGLNIFNCLRVFLVGRNVQLHGYKTVLFSWDNLDLGFIFIAIVLYLTAVIWDYAIDLKTENELTV